MVLFTSWNVNGLRDVHKINKVFTSLNESYVGIACLQETFWDDDFIAKFKHLWDGEIFFNNYSHDKRRGVAILVSKRFPWPVKHVQSDDEGRIIHVSVQLDDGELSLINVYAPNSCREKVLFWHKLSNFIGNNPRRCILGDFNEVLDFKVG